MIARSIVLSAARHDCGPPAETRPPVEMRGYTTGLTVNREESIT